MRTGFIQRTKSDTIALSWIYKLALALIIITLSADAWSQRPIAIKVVDRTDTTVKIPYATIFNKKSLSRFTTNENGESTILAGITDSLLVTRLGYMDVLLATDGSSQNIMVSMKPAIYALDEVNVKPKPPIMELLQKAKTNLSNHSDGRSFEQKGFFRERVLEGTKLVGYLDAFVKLYNGGYSTKYGDDQLRYLNSDLIAIPHFRRSAYPSYFTIDETIKRFNWVNIPNILMLVYEKKKYLHRRIFEDVAFKAFQYEYVDVLAAENGGQDVYAIKFSLKEEYRAKAIDNFKRQKGNLLFSGLLYITAQSNDLVGFTIDQSEYEELIWKSRTGMPVLNLEVRYAAIDGKKLLSSIVSTSTYKKGDIAFKVVDELGIEDENANELTEAQIKQTYGSTSIYKGARIQGTPQKPNPFDPTLWQLHRISVNDDAELSSRYGMPLSMQFLNYRTIYTNLK